MTRITATLHEDRYTFLIISRSFILRMRNMSDKSCRENQNALFMFSKFFPENCVVCGMMWKYSVRARRAIYNNSLIYSLRFNLAIFTIYVHNYSLCIYNYKLMYTYTCNIQNHRCKLYKLRPAQ